MIIFAKKLLMKKFLGLFCLIFMCVFLFPVGTHSSKTNNQPNPKKGKVIPSVVAPKTCRTPMRFICLPNIDAEKNIRSSFASILMLRL